MSEGLLFIENEFIAYTTDHYLPIVVLFLVGIVLTLIGKKSNDDNFKTKLGVGLSMIPFLSILTTYPFYFIEGFDLKEDLPLHLCRFLCLTAPLVMYYRNRFWLGVFYFFIVVGTLNANITPDLSFTFPHYSYFNYWLQHTGLLILPIYAIFVYDLDIKWRDYINAYLVLNGFIVATLLINLTLGSNYMYTLKKPSVASLLDLLGPWPVYLITGQILVIGLCLIAMLPFIIANKLK